MANPFRRNASAMLLVRKLSECSSVSEPIWAFGCQANGLAHWHRYSDSTGEVYGSEWSTCQIRADSRTGGFMNGNGKRVLVIDDDADAGFFYGGAVGADWLQHVAGI